MYWVDHRGSTRDTSANRRRFSVMARRSSHVGLDRISQQPETMGGKACIRGTLVTVAMIVGQMGAGNSADEIMAEYPYLEREDILQALRYAAWRTEEHELYWTDSEPHWRLPISIVANR
jgi:uncharacterized protein (DUF433 family)